MTEQPQDGGEQIVEELREFLAALVSAAAPLVAQVSPGPDAPEAECTWCPVCALVALSRGEQHPLLTALGTRGAALLTALRDVVSDSVQAHGEHGAQAHGGHGGQDGRDAAGGARDDAERGGSGRAGGEGARREESPDTGAGSTAPVRFERIAVTVAPGPSRGGAGSGP